MSTQSDDTQEQRINKLIAEYLRAADAGEPVDPEKFIAQHPEHAEELRSFLTDLDAFKTSPTSPTTKLGDYELLGEIARGGMGVVYRARQISLNRTVAVKTILSGSLAAQGDIQRFRLEAEAAASVEHPNIVPIYEIGTHQEHLYFSMKLISGGSLSDKLEHFVKNPTESARLLLSVSRAIHFAHQRGILHRDLKPANILLDEKNEPHLTDFGLAKRVDRDSELTRTGSIIGTPAYMSPEQAAGNAQRLTTATDVYSLGAILYALLTGQPPFKGETVLETLQKVKSGEVVPPRKNKPSVNRDLETVCLKCLEKDPQKRYPSASAVAAELERWLKGEPLLARPLGSAERLARWGARNPVLAAGAFSLLAVVLALSATALSLVREQDETLRREGCQNNAFAAKLAAGAFLRQLEQHRENVRQLAADPALQEACGTAIGLRNFLKEKVEAPSVPGTAGIASLFVIDNEGTLIAIWPEKDPVVGKNFAHRQYFKEALDPEHLGKPELSRVFRSKNDGLDKLAVTMTFIPKPGSKPWVLVATIPTSQTLSLDALDEHHKVVLFAPKDNEPDKYVILVHPSYRAGESVTVENMDFKQSDQYEDPLSNELHPELKGRWLAGFSRVETTELQVLVQQRYDDAVASQKSFLNRFLGWGVGIVTLGLLLLGVLRFVWIKRATR